MSLETILVWVIIGGIAGLLAQWLIRGVNLGCIGTVVVGIVGAFVGGWLFHQLGISIGSGIVNEIVTAFVGAAVLLLLMKILRRL